MRRRRLRQLLLATGVAALLCGVFVAGLVYAVIFRDLPEIYELADYRPKLITQILAADGQVVGELAEERRVIVPIEDVPQYLVDAFVAAEDDSFYRHEGLDYQSILRAAWKNLRAGGVRQGGSTITQQVAKTFLLSSERTFVRKLKDMVLARRIEQNLEKDEILHLYLNQIYLGSGAYGIEEAARKYFDRSVGELSLAQAALIAGLVPRPSAYSPRVNPDLAQQRRRFVLRRMLEEGFIQPEEHDAALAEEVSVVERPPSELRAAVAYFNEEVRRYLYARYGEQEVLTAGLVVRTTMDADAQLAAYRAVRQGLRDHDRRTGYRGPIRQVPEEEWPEVLDEIGQANAAVEERLGSVIQGLVVEVSDEEERARIRLGPERETHLTLEAVSWAREPDPELDGSSTRIRKLSRALKEGYLVQLERTGEVEAGSEESSAEAADPGDAAPEPVPTYALFQEPLAEGALFSMEVATGRVQAITGGYSFEKSQFDRAVQMRRQPGSAFKPIVYATALMRGYTPASIVYDTPVVWRDDATGFTWKPENYSEKFYGAITLRQALAKSRNVATVKVLRDIGVRPVIEMAQALGIERDLVPNLSLGLGASEVTLAELVRAYGTFPAGGRKVEPVFILEIRDRDGEPLTEQVRLLEALDWVQNGEPPEEEVLELDREDLLEKIRAELTAEVDRADVPLAPPSGYSLDPVTAYLMTDMLSAVVQEGTGRRVKALKKPTGGKTGTTNDLKDAWYIGFSPKVVAGVWVGYDAARNLGRNETGSRAASPIFLDYARHVLADDPPTRFPEPEGVVFVRIDRDTGKLACPQDKDFIFQPFREGTAPIDRAPCGEGSNGSAPFRGRLD